MRAAPEFDSAFLLEFESLPGYPDGPIDWNAVFGRHAPLRVEVGVGNSPFLIEVAKEEPEFNYLGFEYSPKRVRKFLKKVDKTEVECIRMLDVNVDRFIGRFFAPGCVDHLFLNHPDPWPKQRHRKKRFVREQNNPIVCAMLRPGGRYSLRTDSPDYAHEMLRVLDGCPSLVNEAGEGHFAAGPLYPIETPYETKFKRAGLPIHYLEYRRVEPERE